MTRPAVRRTVGLAGLGVALVLLLALSVAVGSNPLPLDTVWRMLTAPDGSFEAIIVRDQRIPRTVLVVVVGAALGVAGALMQSLTRNPLADPGILGVNAGASLAVAVTGITSVWFYLWFAFAGAAAAAAVYLLGGGGRRAPDPAQLALAGVAVSMAVSAVVQGVVLSNTNAFNEFRFWVAGSAEGRGYPVTLAVLGFIVAGLILAALVAPALNALALGDESGRSLGVHVARTRVLVVVAITLLAGAATAAVGPLMFLGLVVPFVARAICGPDQRWITPTCILAAPVVALVADVAARTVVAPQEVQLGIMTALLGGPVFIAVVRRRRIEAL
ncbi:iron ABC transporter permease [Corynebacterium bovis]|uniref:FecCD family ABC transporter permease n=1 Tax=Corynebacterium bovis TaxID=36808 RepID=UPI0025505287|nr:iron ABC transporter permease [Corynebacterium bovis]MDK8510551.1 iron ABC transporter permease [Corynebacterium bovis]